MENVGRPSSFHRNIRNCFGIQGVGYISESGQKGRAHGQKDIKGRRKNIIIITAVSFEILFVVFVVF